MCKNCLYRFDVSGEQCAMKSGKHCSGRGYWVNSGGRLSYRGDEENRGDNQKITNKRISDTIIKKLIK